MVIFYICNNISQNLAKFRILPYSEIVARGQNPSKSKICQKMAMFKQLNGPISSKLKIKFDPSVERFWCELFKIIKRTWSKKSTQKVLPGLLHKLLFHKMKLGLVFRPYIKMSLPVSHRSQMNFLSNTPPIWWWDCDLCWFKPMAIPVVEFSWEGYKIRKVFGQKSTVAKWNNWILWIGVMGRCQKVPKFDFQSQFSTSKIIGILLDFISSKNTK